MGLTRCRLVICTLAMEASMISGVPSRMNVRCLKN